MNKLSLPIAALALASIMQSCYKEGPDHKWNRGIGPNGLDSIIVEPIGIDTDGDGAPDKIIQMTSDVGSETYPDKTSVDKKCFNNSPTKCLEGGGLYYPDDANNKSLEAIFEDTKKALDQDGDGKMDAAMLIADTIVPAVAQNIATVAADSTVSKLLVSQGVADVTSSASNKVADAVIKADSLAKYDAEKLNSAIQTAAQSVFIGGTLTDKLNQEIALAVKAATDSTVKELVKANPAYIDEEKLAATVQDAVAAAIQDVVQAYIQEAVESAITSSLTASSNKVLTNAQIAEIAKVVAKESSQNVASDVIMDIAADQAATVQTAVAQAIYSQPQYETKPVQGICPNGYHIPSDREWKEIELALGMPASEVHLSGIYADRGASVGMAKVFETELSLQYGGYGTVDGRYAQYNEVSVFATSSVGKDAEGEYVWVRYIDNLGDHKGVIRKKLRKGTLMSVRCIK